jgi:hypothetical protein
LALTIAADLLFLAATALLVGTVVHGGFPFAML